MPIDWSELDDDLRNANHNLNNAVDRLTRLGDPMAPLLDTTPDLDRALGLLGERLAP